MRILYLCHRIPYPPDKGDKIRAFHELRALADRHEVDVFTFADDPCDLHHRVALSAYCRHLTVVAIKPLLARARSLPYLLSRKPLTIPYFYSAEMKTKLREAARQRGYDRVVVYSSTMFQYVDCAGQTPVLADLVDVDSDKWMQYASLPGLLSSIYRREGKRLRQFEATVCARSAVAIVSTAREAGLLREIAAAARIAVVRNGVDSAFFDPAAIPRRPGPPTIVFTGDMGYFPNQGAVAFFARSVLPVIRNSVPAARFVIVGRNPNRKVLELQSMQGVEVTGFVPDVRTYLSLAHVAVAPFSIAAGVQNKILEAMAFALPVVATTKAVQGLSPSVAESVRCGNTAGELASHVLEFLRKPQLAAETGAKGRSRVVAEYDWGGAMDRFVRLVESPGSGLSDGTSKPVMAMAADTEMLTRRRLIP
jgi:sugar transferase (PEP-CTERM/EpsH1 system associated)